MSELIRLRPPVTPAVRPDLTFLLRIKNRQYNAYAYALFENPQVDAQQCMFTQRRLWAERVGENRAKLDILYECMSINALSSENGPLEFIRTRGSSEWLQQMVFKTVHHVQLVQSDERWLFQVPMVDDASADPMTRRPGSLVVLLIQMNAYVHALHDNVSLETLASAQCAVGNDARMMHVICPIAVVPSGAAHYCPRSVPQRAGVLPYTVLDVSTEMQLHLHRNAAAALKARDELYPRFYGQYLVSGAHHTLIDMWPTPGGPFMRDNEVLSYSTDALHCLLAGLVRFHCERVALLRSDRARNGVRLGSADDRSTEFIFECLYTETVAHPDMSMRRLMSRQGFASLCRQVYLVLIACGTPAARRRAHWFRDTLTAAVAFLLQVENTCESENETLRFLQAAGLVRYPDVPADEKRYARREDVIDVRRLPLNDHYPIAVRAAGTHEGDADLIDYYMQHLPNAANRSEVLWIFEVDFGFYTAAMHRGARDSFRRGDVVMRNGRAQLIWLHLSALRDMSAGEVDPLFATTKNKQPWLADLFSTLISGTDLTYGHYTSASEVQRLPSLCNTALDDSANLAVVHTTTRAARTKIALVTKSCTDAEKMRRLQQASLPSHYRNKLSHAEGRLRRIIDKILLPCLPVTAEAFAPRRPKHLRDFPLRGERVQQFVARFGADAARKTKPTSETDDDNDEPDLVTFYDLENADVAALANNEYGVEDRGELYDVAKGDFRAMNVSTAAAQCSDGDLIERLYQRRALPPCQMHLENVLRDERGPGLGHFNLMDYVTQMLGNHGVIDIEDIAQHVQRVEEQMPAARATKAQKHAAEVRGFVPLYKKKMRENVEYERQRYGTARSACGALSCAQVQSRKAANSTGASIRCPYAEYRDNHITYEQLVAARGGEPLTASQRAQLESGGGDARAATRICAAHAARATSSSLVIRYPRDYTRVTLNAEWEAQEQAQNVPS